MDLHAWITQQVDHVERLIEENEFPPSQTEGVRLRCEADRRILARHRLDPNVTYEPACEGCGTYGDMEMSNVDNLNDCPELLDLAHAHGITPEILASLDRPTPPEPQPRDGRRLGLGDIHATPPITTSQVPAALRGPRWSPRHGPVRDQLHDRRRRDRPRRQGRQEHRRRRLPLPRHQRSRGRLRPQRERPQYRPRRGAQGGDRLMARLQILELPEGSNDDRPPFVLVIDQVDDELAEDIARWPDDIARRTGAQHILCFPGTIDIPANDTSAYLASRGADQELVVELGDQDMSQLIDKTVRRNPRGHA